MISRDPIQLLPINSDDVREQDSTRYTLLQDILVKANDSFTNRQVISESEITVKEEPEKDLTIAKTNAIASTVFQFMMTPAYFVRWLASALYDLLGFSKIKCAIELFTPQGFRGMVSSGAGYCLGTFYAMQGAPYVSNTLVEKTMATICNYVGTRSVTQNLVTAGGKVLWGPFIQPTIVIFGGIAGSYALVFVGNYIYKLCFDNRIERELIEEWKEAAEEMISERNAIEPDQIPKSISIEELV